MIQASTSWACPNRSSPPYYSAAHPRHPLDFSTFSPLAVPLCRTPWAAHQVPAAATAAASSDPPRCAAAHCARKGGRSPRAERALASAPGTSPHAPGARAGSTTGCGSGAGRPDGCWRCWNQQKRGEKKRNMNAKQEKIEHLQSK